MGLIEGPTRRADQISRQKEKNRAHPSITAPRSQPPFILNKSPKQLAAHSIRAALRLSVSVLSPTASTAPSTPLTSPSRFCNVPIIHIRPGRRPLRSLRPSPSTSPVPTLRVPHHLPASSVHCANVVPRSPGMPIRRICTWSSTTKACLSPTVTCARANLASLRCHPLFGRASRWRGGHSGHGR